VAVVWCGCNRGTTYQTADLSGKVTFKGQPLPGGRVTFVADKGGTSTSGTIDENGNYKCSAPVGDIHIAVDNRMLEKKAAPGPILHRPDSEGPSSLKGTYVKIPEKYYSADSSNLTLKVTSGSQTHDIPLE